MHKTLFAFSITAAACGARAPQTTLPVEYACGQAAVVRHDKMLELRERSASLVGVGTSAAKLGWRDDAGEHFVTWPVSPTDVEALEFVLPWDPRQDATERFYDTSTGTSTADWRLVRREVCTARGGYTDALSRYIRGESYDQLAADLAHGDRDEARELVHHALIALQRRYFRDR
jgi:hypothetical protein